MNRSLHLTVARLAGVLAAVTALVLVPSAANAETKSHTDGIGDVLAMIGSDDPDAEPAVDPARKEGDIRTIRVSNFANTVRIRLGIRELTRTGLGKSAVFSIRSDKGSRIAFVEAHRGKWGGTQELVDGNFDKVKCGTMTHKIDYVNNAVLLTIPRSCLGSPRWVRVAGTVTTADMVGDSDVNIYIDDARSSSKYPNSVYGPRVHRG